MLKGIINLPKHFYCKSLMLQIMYRRAKMSVSANPYCKVRSSGFYRGNYNLRVFLTFRMLVGKPSRQYLIHVITILLLMMQRISGIVNSGAIQR